MTEAGASGLGVEISPQLVEVSRKAARGQDDDAAVARAEVDHVVARADAGQAKHFQRDVVGRGDEGHLFPELGPGAARAQGQREQQGGGERAAFHGPHLSRRAAAALSYRRACPAPTEVRATAPRFQPAPLRALHGTQNQEASMAATTGKSSTTRAGASSKSPGNSASRGKASSAAMSGRAQAGTKSPKSGSRSERSSMGSGTKSSKSK